MMTFEGIAGGIGLIASILGIIVALVKIIPIIGGFGREYSHLVDSSLRRKQFDLAIAFAEKIANAHRRKKELLKIAKKALESEEYAVVKKILKLLDEKVI